MSVISKEINEIISLFKEKVSDFGDLAQFMTKLSTIIKKHDGVPLSNIQDISLVINQCLNYSLPSGVHEKTLDCLAILFTKIDHKYIIYFLPGLSSLYPKASYEVKPKILGLFDSILPSHDLLELLPSLTSMCLSFDNNDAAFDVLDKLLSMDSKCFFASVFRSAAILPTTRNLALSYLNNCYSRKAGSQIFENTELIKFAVARIVFDDNLVFIRSFFDFIVTIFSELPNQNELVEAFLVSLLIREPSIFRRISKYLENKEVTRNAFFAILNLELLSKMNPFLIEDSDLPAKNLHVAPLQIYEILLKENLIDFDCEILLKIFNYISQRHSSSTFNQLLSLWHKIYAQIDFSTFFSEYFKISEKLDDKILKLLPKLMTFGTNFDTKISNEEISAVLSDFSRRKLSDFECEFLTISLENRKPSLRIADISLDFIESNVSLASSELLWSILDFGSDKLNFGLQEKFFENIFSQYSRCVLPVLELSCRIITQSEDEIIEKYLKDLILSLCSRLGEKFSVSTRQAIVNDLIFLNDKLENRSLTFTEIALFNVSAVESILISWSLDNPDDAIDIPKFSEKLKFPKQLQNLLGNPEVIKKLPKKLISEQAFSLILYQCIEVEEIYKIDWMIYLSECSSEISAAEFRTATVPVFEILQIEVEKIYKIDDFTDSLTHFWIRICEAYQISVLPWAISLAEKYQRIELFKFLLQSSLSLKSIYPNLFSSIDFLTPFHQMLFAVSTNFDNFFSCLEILFFSSNQLTDLQDFVISVLLICEVSDNFEKLLKFLSIKSKKIYENYKKITFPDPKIFEPEKSVKISLKLPTLDYSASKESLEAPLVLSDLIDKLEKSWTNSIESLDKVHKISQILNQISDYPKIHLILRCAAQIKNLYPKQTFELFSPEFAAVLLEFEQNSPLLPLFYECEISQILLSSLVIKGQKLDGVASNLVIPKKEFTGLSLDKNSEKLLNDHISKVEKLSTIDALISLMICYGSQLILSTKKIKSEFLRLSVNVIKTSPQPDESFLNFSALFVAILTSSDAEFYAKSVPLPPLASSDKTTSPSSSLFSVFRADKDDTINNCLMELAEILGPMIPSLSRHSPSYESISIVLTYTKITPASSNRAFFTAVLPLLMSFEHEDLLETFVKKVLGSDNSIMDLAVEFSKSTNCSFISLVGFFLRYFHLQEDEIGLIVFSLNQRLDKSNCDEVLMCITIIISRYPLFSLRDHLSVMCLIFYHCKMYSDNLEMVSETQKALDSLNSPEFYSIESFLFFDNQCKPFKECEIECTNSFELLGKRFNSKKFHQYWDLIKL